MSLSDKEKNNAQIIDLLFQLGVTYLEKRDYNSSIDKFRKIIDLGETNAKIYLNLCKAYILKEQFDADSQKIFEKSLEFEPENPVLNVVLSQLYLDAGREDDQALQVYRNALKHNAQNADEISSKLIKVSFQQGNIETARELLLHFIDKPDKILSFLPLYVVNEWKHQGFDRVADYLKNAIKAHEDLAFYRWLVVNYLQAERQSLEPFELSHEDFHLCFKYVNCINSFDQLLDIYLYPTIEQMLLRYWKKFNDASKDRMEEYEIFLAENALSNIWEKALNRKDQSKNQSILQECSIWKKLKFWNLSREGDENALSNEKNESDVINLIENQAETLMIMRWKGIASDDVSEVLSKSILTISVTENTFIGGFKSNDGFLLFCKDVNCPIKIAVNFVQQHSTITSHDLNNGDKVHFIIHKLSKRVKNREKSIIHDLQTVLSTFQLEREMFYQDSRFDQWNINSSYQVFVTSTLKEKINSDSQFSLELVELSAQHPTTEKKFEIYQLTWNDSLAKIVRGEIQEIGRFKLLKQLHHNQVFSSFKAVDSFLDRLVVVKILSPDFKISNDSNSMTDLFLREAKFLGKLTHPNIALVYDIGKEQDFYFIAREYIDGMPLAVQKSMNKNINIKKTLEICFKIAQTLNYSHQKNIFHGRLQPNNIFVLNNNDVKIADFQVVSFTIPLKTYQTLSLKQLTYFAPEQIDNNAFDNLTDIFSMGVTIYEMLTDQNPFHDEDRDKIFNNILTRTPQPPTFYNPNLPIELDHLVLTAIEKSPQRRFTNMGVLAKELMELIVKLGD